MQYLDASLKMTEWSVPLTIPSLQSHETPYLMYVILLPISYMLWTNSLPIVHIVHNVETYT